MEKYFKTVKHTGRQIQIFRRSRNVINKLCSLCARDVRVFDW